MRNSWLWMAVVLASCTHMRAEDETVAEHRNDALLHEQKARDERARFDPSDVQRAATRIPGLDLQGGIPGGRIEPYNPSAEHLAEADREMREANEHLAAAKQLLAFEDKACAGLSEAQRSACPMFASTVSRVTPTNEGFTLTFKPTADVPQTYRRLSCHLAWAVANGFDKPSCPLFLEGTTLQRAGADGISFEGESKSVTLALQAQARRVFLGSESARAP
jgi:hypothetical protein